MERRKLMAVEQFLGSGVSGILRTGPPPALPDLCPRPLKHFLVRRVFPQNEVFDDLEEPPSFLLLCLLGRKEIRVARRVIHHLSEDDSTSGRQRPLCPPLVQRGRISSIDVAYRGNPSALHK